MAKVSIRRSDSEAAEQFRWNLTGDSSPQDALFPGLVDREIGRGEFRGLEFLHVEARSIINEVPAAAGLPFRYTINPYRGCSHACAYCISGDTPILMGDGRTRPLSELRPGDVVYGTERQGAYRRYVRTLVLDHWSTMKPGYRVTLEDGTELIASADHRFLSDRGWKHVARDHGPGSSLTRGDEMVAVHLASAGGGTAGGRASVALAAPLQLEETLVGVASVEPLGFEMPMFDITTGTGDFIANGVVSHNCFARPTHEYLNLDIGADFDSKIVVKVNAVERLRAELAPKRWAGEPIAMGTNTDPYQRAEGKYRLTRGVVETLTEFANPFSILTKSTLILRDLDVLIEAAERAEVATNFSIGTLDEEVWKLTEPGTPHPMRRMEAVAKLNEAGVPCGVLVAPVIPGLSDSPEQLDAVVAAALDAGATSITPITLHLRPKVREHFLGWLRERRPDLLRRYREIYGRRRSYAPEGLRQAIGDRVTRALERHGGLRSEPPPLRRGRRAEPAPTEEPEPQLSLGF